MKTRILLLMLISALVLATSCKKEDDDTNEPATISGNWNLKNVSGGFTGLDIDFTPGQVIWNFNLETQILTVQNNIIASGSEDTYSGFETGMYDFEIQENEGLKSLLVDGINYGFVTFTDNILQLDEGVAVDGIMKTFER